MPKKQKSQRTGPTELDSTYILKLVLYLILGSQWLYVVNTTGSWQIPLPLGLVIGLMFASHDHFRIDRKVEYAVLLVAAFVGYWAQVGLRFVL